MSNVAARAKFGSRLPRAPNTIVPFRIPGINTSWGKHTRFSKREVLINTPGQRKFLSKQQRRLRAPAKSVNITAGGRNDAALAKRHAPSSALR